MTEEDVKEIVETAAKVTAKQCFYAFIGGLLGGPAGAAAGVAVASAETATDA